MSFDEDVGVILQVNPVSSQVCVDELDAEVVKSLLVTCTILHQLG